MTNLSIVSQDKVCENQVIRQQPDAERLSLKLWGLKLQALVFDLFSYNQFLPTNFLISGLKNKDLIFSDKFFGQDLHTRRTSSHQKPAFYFESFFSSEKRENMWSCVEHRNSSKSGRVTKALRQIVFKDIYADRTAINNDAPIATSMLKHIKQGWTMGLESRGICALGQISRDLRLIFWESKIWKFRPVSAVFDLCWPRD